MRKASLREAGLSVQDGQRECGAQTDALKWL